MLKKLAFVIMIGGLLSTVFFSQARAASELPAANAAKTAQPPTARPFARYAGEIVRLGSEDLTLATQRGAISILVSNETNLRSLEGPISFDDLEIGQTIAVLAKNLSDGSLLAQTILLMPASFKIDRFQARSVHGEIWSIDLEASTFELRVRGGNLVFYVTAETIFNSPAGVVENLGDLQLHQRVLVIGKRNKAGELLAVRVIAGRGPITRHPGTIANLDLAGGTLTLNRSDGRTINFRLAKNIHIKSDNPEITLPADLSTGMQVIVVSRGFTNGFPQAVLINIPTLDT
ncbi:MAG: DUF5666 domain-containing protein [Anaerolineales bacterium]|jgi:hypothetical protein